MAFIECWQEKCKYVDWNTDRPHCTHPAPRFKLTPCKLNHVCHLYPVKKPQWAKKGGEE